jgi:coenzyme F420-reducing hydrogenase beta subunit
MRSPEAGADRAPWVSPADIVRSGLCIGCGACVATAGPAGARMELDGYGQFKPLGPRDWFERRTEDFSRTCPFSPAAADEDVIAARNFPDATQRDPHLGRFEATYVGHVAEGEFRAAGSSGGLVTWTASELLRLGLVDAVAHVAPIVPTGEDPAFFRYTLSWDQPALRAGAKSRYHPIELSEVLAAIAAREGRYAVVGTPCFIKTVNLARAQSAVLSERIAFTLGLFCGHMKSTKLVESFAWQMERRIGEVESVEYRLKDPSRPANWYTAFLRLKGGETRQKDWWHLADGDWGAGFFQNSACNFCDDVVAETADIAFGDAWVEPYSSDGRGTNVVVVRSLRLRALLEDAIAQGRLALRPVDAAFVVETQAAGFRHRREGLAYRLTWRRGGVKPRKRVGPGGGGLSWRRKAIYRLRYMNSAWSHRVFAVARRLRRPRIYIAWAQFALQAYHGFAYSRGRLGALLDASERLTRAAARPRP